MSNQATIKSKYTQGKPTDTVVEEFWEILVAMFGFVLPNAWKKSGTGGRRTSTTLDAVVEKHANGIATRVNRRRSQIAKDEGKTSYTGISQTEAVKGIFQGDPELGYSEIDAGKLVDELAKKVGFDRPLSMAQRIEIHDRIFQQYASDPAAQEFITLDDLSDEQVSKFDPPKPSGAKSENGSKAPALNSINTATI